MSFGTYAKKHEIKVITDILDYFGTVEERQMRELFSYMPDSQYGPIMTRLYREGMALRSQDGKLLNSSRRHARKANAANSIMAFWVFIAIKNRIKDFSKGEYPVICTISANSSDYDLIPVTRQNINEVNSYDAELSDSVIRFFVLEDKDLITEIESRFKNDYAFVVGPEGVTNSYKI